MEDKLKRFGKAFGHTFRNLGASVGKVLENLEKSDKEMDEKIKKAMGSVN